MNNPPRLRLVESTLLLPVPAAGGWQPGESVTGDEEDIDDMLSDPVRSLVRDMERLITREGPLLPAIAVRATRRVAQAVIHDSEIHRYSVTTTHVAWLGSVLYFALTGSAPLAPRALSISPARPPPLASVSRHVVTASVELLITTCLAPERRDRFPSVAALEIALGTLPEAAPAPRERVEVERHEDGEDGDRDTIPPASGVTLSREEPAAMSWRRRAGGATS